MLDDLHNLIKRQEEQEAYYNALFEGFTKKLPHVLAELVFMHWEHLAKQRSAYENVLLKMGEKYVRLIFEDFNNAHWLNNNAGPMANLNAVPLPRDNRAHAEKRCADLKKQIPEEYHPELERSFWEDYEDDQKGVLFTYVVYQKMKAVFTEFYIEDIMEFESHILRYFDRSLYLMCTLRYVDEVYSLN